MALALGIVASGILPFTAFYPLGLHVWAWVGLGMIPFGFGCWGLSSVLAVGGKRVESRSGAVV